MNSKILDAATTYVEWLDQMKLNNQIVDYSVTAMRLSLDESGTVVGAIDVSIQPVVTVDRITMNTTMSRYEATSVELANKKYYKTTTIGELSKTFNVDAGVSDASGD